MGQQERPDIDFLSIMGEIDGFTCRTLAEKTV